MRATPRLPALALALSLSLLGGCVESEMKASLRADGSGALATSAKFTEKFSHAIWRLRAIDPTGEVAAEFEKNLPKEPGEALRKELAGQGLRVKEMGFVLKEREMSSKASFDFDRVSALAGLSRLQGVMPEGQGRFELRLTRDADGICTLGIAVDQGGGGTGTGGDAEPEEEPGEAEEAEADGPVDPAKAAEEAKKQEELASILGDMMSEAMEFKARFSIEVPGEVLDFAPEKSGRREGSAVSWDLDFASLMAVGMETAMAGMAEGKSKEETLSRPMFRVRFRMPEGKELPESALYAGAAAPAPADPVPDAPAEGGPPAPAEPAPAGEPK